MIAKTFTPRKARARSLALSPRSHRSPACSRPRPARELVWTPEYAALPRTHPARAPDRPGKARPEKWQERPDACPRRPESRHPMTTGSKRSRSARPTPDPSDAQPGCATSAREPERTQRGGPGRGRFLLTTRRSQHETEPSRSPHRKPTHPGPKPRPASQRRSARPGPRHHDIGGWPGIRVLERHISAADMAYQWRRPALGFGYRPLNTA
jgi:hypothetical protein